MGLKAALASFVLAALALPAQAAFDGIGDCEKLAAVQFKRHDPAFKKFAIDRTAVEEDAFADNIGPMFVSTIYHGKASYESGSGPVTTRFICLHGGVGKHAVFVYTLPQ